MLVFSVCPQCVLIHIVRTSPIQNYLKFSQLSSGFDVFVVDKGYWYTVLEDSVISSVGFWKCLSAINLHSFLETIMEKKFSQKTSIPTCLKLWLSLPTQYSYPDTLGIVWMSVWEVHHIEPLLVWFTISILYELGAVRNKKLISSNSLGVFGWSAQK